MSERKIVVPEGMRKAAGLATKGVDPEGYLFYLAVEAAVCWLLNELETKTKSSPGMYQSESLSESNQRCGYNYAIADILKMFAPPETLPDTLVLCIMRHMDDIEPNERIRRNRAEAALKDYAALKAARP